MNNIDKFITGGERAGDFNPEARVWGEMAVRVIVWCVLQTAGGLTPVAPDRAEARDGDDDSHTPAAGERGS